MKNLIIIGAGGFAREVSWLVDDINDAEEKWNLIGFIDDNTDVYGKKLNGYDVLGGLDYLKCKSEIYYVCAIANVKARKEVVERCDELGFKAATLIHPSVISSKKYNEIGKGCIICANSIITVNVKLGNHVIVNLDCTIGHDVIIEDFVTIYPSVNVSGNCTIGELVELGTGAKIIQGKSIGNNTKIGAGSVVIKDIEADCTAVGSPAKVIKRNVI